MRRRIVSEETCRDISRLRSLWGSMIRRCEDPATFKYEDYGGRGIYVSKKWHDFGIFASWALAHGYEPGLHIDRINNNGPYSPKNCRWVTPQENGNNRRSNRWVTIFGETKTIAQWSRDPRCVVKQGTFGFRIRAGWDPQKALTAPLLDKPLKDACRQGHPYPESLVPNGKCGTVCIHCRRKRDANRSHKRKTA